MTRLCAAVQDTLLSWVSCSEGSLVVVAVCWIGCGVMASSLVGMLAGMFGGMLQGERHRWGCTAHIQESGHGRSKCGRTRLRRRSSLPPDREHTAATPHPALYTSSVRTSLVRSLKPGNEIKEMIEKSVDRLLHLGVHHSRCERPGVLEVTQGWLTAA